MKKFLSVLLATLLAFSVLSVTSSAALTKVTNLTAYNIDDDEVNLKWSKVNGAGGYQVYVYNDVTGKWRKLGNTTKTFFEAEDLASAKTYKFRVRAYNKKVSGTDYSAYAVISATTKPDEVKNVSVSAKTKNSVTLKWSAVKGVTGYRVFIYDASQGKYVQKAAVKGTSAKVSGLKEGTSYKFKVRANFKVDGKNNFGEFSDVLSVKTKGTVATSTPAEKLIDKAKAESVALNHAGLKKAQVKFFECKLDVENGVKVYEIEFNYGVYEYDYKINAVTGKIVKSEKSMDL